MNNQTNLMREMLKKGDALRPSYEDFDFDGLDSTQQAWIRRLTKFTRFRHRVESYFQEVRLSNEMKLLFIEQHSMKLGDRVFYDIESKRQVYLQQVQAIPYLGAVFAFGFFIVYAIKTPLTSNLYKETVYSMALGLGMASCVPLYYRKAYLQRVGEAYDVLKARFEKFPEQAVPDSENVVKNFGSTRWNDAEYQSEEDLQDDDSIGVFDGDELDHRRIQKIELYDSL